jgi:hypothetical protein
MWIVDWTKLTYSTIDTVFTVPNKNKTRVLLYLFILMSLALSLAFKYDYPILPDRNKPTVGADVHFWHDIANFPDLVLQKNPIAMATIFSSFPLLCLKQLCKYSKKTTEISINFILKKIKFKVII